MALITIHSAPALDSFTPLAEHQSQTPTSFYDARPVLHHHSTGVRAAVLLDHVTKLPIFPVGDEQIRHEAVEGRPEETPIMANVEVFVSSQNLTLWNASLSAGISIPYPTIFLHAIRRLTDTTVDPARELQVLYMNLFLPDPETQQAADDDEPQIIELTLYPPLSEDGMQECYDAISVCSNFHADPADGDEEMGEGEDSRIIFEGSVGYEGISGLSGVQAGAADGGLPPPFPGSGGWITAENVSEYFDADGNWIVDTDESGEGFRDGAGRVRTRQEMNGDGVNGHEEHDDDAKRQRTD